MNIPSISTIAAPALEPDQKMAAKVEGSAEYDECERDGKQCPECSLLKSENRELKSKNSKLKSKKNKCKIKIRQLETEIRMLRQQQQDQQSRFDDAEAAQALLEVVTRYKRCPTMVKKVLLGYLKARHEETYPDPSNKVEFVKICRRLLLRKVKDSLRSFGKMGAWKEFKEEVLNDDKFFDIVSEVYGQIKYRENKQERARLKYLKSDRPASKKRDPEAAKLQLPPRAPKKAKAHGKGR